MSCYCCNLTYFNSTRLLQLLQNMGSSHTHIVMNLCKDTIAGLCQADICNIDGK